MGPAQASPNEARQRLLEHLKRWFENAPALLASRQLEQAAVHGQALTLEIQALRANHTPDANRASQALDRLCCTMRSAVELAHAQASNEQGLAEASSWLEPARAMQRNFEAQERAWWHGNLAAQDFMSGHEVLIQDTLDSLARNLGLERPHPPSPLAQATDPGDSAGQRPQRSIEVPA